jgi:hypothetical protein
MFTFAGGAHMPRRNGPEILPHTSIRLENGEVVMPGDEAKLSGLKKEELDRLQNDAGAIAGFVPARKGATEPPEQLSSAQATPGATNAGLPNQER